MCLELNLSLKISILYAMSPNQREKKGQVCREEFLEKYSRKRLIEQYEILFNR